jgi:hypothetical protein
MLQISLCEESSAFNDIHNARVLSNLGLVVGPRTTNLREEVQTLRNALCTLSIIYLCSQNLISISFRTHYRERMKSSNTLKEKTQSWSKAVRESTSLQEQHELLRNWFIMMYPTFQSSTTSYFWTEHNACPKCRSTIQRGHKLAWRSLDLKLRDFWLDLSLLITYFWKESPGRSWFHPAFHVWGFFSICRKSLV